MSTLGIDNKEEFDALTTAKAFFVRHAIKCICLKEDDKVVDIFSLGYGTKEALLQQRKVISVACTNKQMTELEALCHSTMDEDDDLKRTIRFLVNVRMQKDEITTMEPVTAIKEPL
ncbi:hypothetical protein L7F22_026672, partial [Adiantum nelumboides]|nr:hypothetical protein [Adiantum nelumboides]